MNQPHSPHRTNKSTWNIVLDIILLILIALLSFSGFVTSQLLPSGHGGRGAASRLFLGIHRHDWLWFHQLIGVILLIGLVAHIILHWKYISAFFHKHIKSPILRTTVYVMLALLLLVACVPWLISSFI